jgi:DnaJ-class molecular chaperone
MTEDLYKTLGVAKTASDDEVRKAYRRLAKTCHPDTNPGDKAAEERFKAISRAYAILGEPAKRKRYDRGQIDADGNERGPQGFPFGAGRQRGYNAGSETRGPFGRAGFDFSHSPGGGGGFANFEDILGDLFGGASRAGGGTRGGQARQPSGEDMKLAVTVDFLDAAKGAKRRVGLPDGRHLDVTIPAGVEAGQVLRLKGQGVAGGDALVEVQVTPHAGFRREGLDIHLDQSVPLALAINGGKVTVPTIDGNVAVSVPPWTSSGKTLRLKGRGINKGGHRGDQMVRLELELPTAKDRGLEDWAKSRADTKV